MSGKFLLVEARGKWSRAMMWSLAAALLLHLPLTPLALIWSLLGPLLRQDSHDWDYQEDKVLIPITLEEDAPKPPVEVETIQQPAEGKNTPVPSVAARPRPIQPKQVKHPASRELADAGSESGVDAASEAGGRDAVSVFVADAGRSRALASPFDAEASPSAQGVGRSDAGVAQGGRVHDTLSLTGSVQKAVNGKPNVTLIAWFSTMRSHPLGQYVGSLLSCSPQWHDFLDSGIDPLRDLETVMLSGPRMVDTSKITAAIVHRIERPVLQQALARMVRQGGGGAAFLEAPPGELAVKVIADHAVRIIATHPKDMLLITPPEGYEQVRAIREPLTLPAGAGRALSLTLLTPARPLRRLGANLPDSLSEMRLDVRAASGGGLEIEIEFDDQDAQAAELHARELTSQLLSPYAAFLGDTRFLAEGARLRATVQLSRFTSAMAIGFVRSSVCPGDGGISR